MLPSTALIIAIILIVVSTILYMISAALVASAVKDAVQIHDNNATKNGPPQRIQGSGAVGKSVGASLVFVIGLGCQLAAIAFGIVWTVQVTRASDRVLKNMSRM